MSEPHVSTWEALEYVEMIKHFTEKIGFMSLLGVVLAWLLPTIREVVSIELTATLIACTLLSALTIGGHQYYKHKARRAM
jgi:hypothetical protein